MPLITVLHGSNDLYGASRVLLQDIAVLHDLGHRTAVVLPSDGPLTSALRALDADVAIEDLRVLRRVGSPTELRPPLRLPRLAHDADIVVTWTLALSGYLPSLRLRRKSTVASVHEILGGGVGGMLARGTALFADALMTNSQTTTDWMVENGAHREAIQLAYPEAPTFAPHPVPSHPPSRLDVLLAGRVNGHKGHIEAVAASRKARQRGVDVRLTLVGGSFPGQEAHLRALVEEIRGEAWVTYSGEVDDITPFLIDSDVMLVPTTRPEPFGVVALEAWAAGRRVIASDAGGLAEATRMVAGVSFPLGDVAALADAIERVASTPSLRDSPPGDAEVSRMCTAAARRDAWKLTLARLEGHGQARAAS